MNDEAKKFTPDWVIPPGATIADLLQERGWTQVEFASRIDYTPKHVNLLIKGKESINEETALRLERVLGSSVGFWLTLEARYREALTRRSEYVSLENYFDWLKEIPLKDMINFGWINKFPNKAEQVAECLRFFGVASVEVWRRKWGGDLAAFRSQKLQDKHKGAIAAWIRQCEHQANSLDCQSYNARKFKEILQEIRGLTKEEEASVFIEKLRKLCASAGVILAIVPAPTDCPVCGATRWLTPEKALLMLSDRYKSNDQFWFSFFHEAAHLLFHAKKVLFIDTIGPLDGEDEQQADDFASTTLIPTEQAKQLFELPHNEDAIKKFAKGLGISPGIVVDRMQREKLLGWKTRLNGLKTEVRFPSGN
jgi:addiction module HigA family antidote